MENIFAKRLKSARIMKGLSMDALCDVMGHIVSKQSLSKYENAKMLPDSTVLIALSKALEVSVDYLFRPYKIEMPSIEFRKKRFDKINLKQLVEIQREKLLLKEKDINNQIKNKLKILKKELEYRSVKISKYSINDILKQGYTLTRKNGKIVKRGIELSKKDDLEIQFLDVKIKTTVK